MSAQLRWIKYFSIPWIISLSLVVGASQWTAVAASEKVAPIHRKILALYDANEDATASANKIFQNCQTVLNYLGMVVDHRDANLPLPGPSEMKDYRGVLTWFSSPGIQRPETYLAWLNEQLERGKKLVIIGSAGFSEDKLPPEKGPLIEAVYAHLGLKHTGNYTNRRMYLRYVDMDPAMVNFERRYPPVPELYEQFIPTDASTKVHLRLTRTDRPDGQSAVVTTGPGGGMIWGPFALWQEKTAPFRRKWYVNPFAFFVRAFDLADLPRPDPTTINGRRIAFSHIDGDAFTGFTEVMPNAVCADVIRERILRRYPFPVTVSVIVGEIDPEALGNDHLVSLSRQIFALANVEPASHSYSHPFYWDPDFDNTEANYPSQYGMKIPGYAFDAAMEIDYSVRYITDVLAPSGKPCRVFLWTGNCKPLASHIERCDDLGLLNMNGGDTVFDGANDSYTAVAPLYREIKGRHQYHIGQANENILTNLWKGPFYGFRKIITTMERTGSPRRIKPIDVYYHFYSGQYNASIGALEAVYDWVLTQPIFPMFASAYLRVAQSWIGCQLSEDDAERRYVVSDYGACLTIRFDDENRALDLSRCKNVLGFMEDPRGLYVHLAPGKTSATIAFHPLDGSESKRSMAPHIRQANGWIRDFSIADDTIAFDFDGFGAGLVQLAGMKPGSTYGVKTSSSAKKPGMVTADGGGILTLTNLSDGRVEIGSR